MTDQSSDYPVFDYNPYNLGGDFLAAIGLVVASSVQTEKIVLNAIAGCANIDAEYGGAILTHMPPRVQLNALRSAAQICLDDTDALAELYEILDQVGIAYNKRNSIVHEQWNRFPPTNQIFRSKESARDGYTIENVPVKLEEIKADAAFIYSVGMRLQKWLMNHDLQPAMPPKRNRGHKTKAAIKKLHKQK